MIGRRRFGDVVDRQIDLFVREHRGLIEDCLAAERAYNRADRHEAEERYGDYADLVDLGTQLLADMRDAYVRTLDEPEAEQYAATFHEAVRRRLPRFALELEDT